MVNISSSLCNASNDESTSAKTSSSTGYEPGQHLISPLTDAAKKLANMRDLKQQSRSQTKEKSGVSWEEAETFKSTRNQVHEICFAHNQVHETSTIANRSTRPSLKS